MSAGGDVCQAVAIVGQLSLIPLRSPIVVGDDDYDDEDDEIGMTRLAVNLRARKLSHSSLRMS